MVNLEQGIYFSETNEASESTEQKKLGRKPLPEDERLRRQKESQRKSDQRYYTAHREEEIARTRTWQKNNPDKDKAYKQSYATSNAVKRSERRRKRYRENVEQDGKQVRNYTRRQNQQES